MIIKVPIYVEIDSISDNENLSLLVLLLGTRLTRILRKENLEIQFTEAEKHAIRKLQVGELSIKTKEQALEYLRTKK
jgi:hypothetical protein